MFLIYTVGKPGLVNNTEASDTSKKTAIVGINRIASTIYENPDLLKLTQDHLAGFLNIDPITDDVDLAKFPNLLGDIADLKSLAAQHAISRVILAIDPKDIQKLHYVIQICEAAEMPYELLADSYEVDYDGAFAKILKESAIEMPAEYWLQRGLDLLFSTIMFLVFMPSYFLIALGIKLESRGPVLYSQERVGKDGQVFRIYKFRSMFTDAEKYSGPQLATQNDPRITRVGRFLRKTRLDELPQLMNVLRGDMSLVGPRPERPYFVDKYSKEIPNYRDRLRVKPGLTGHAQVETGYDESLEDVKVKVKHDLYYIRHRNSSGLYWQIMFKTVWVVLTAKGQ